MTTNISPGNILIVDDEVNIRHGLRAVLAKEGHEIQEAASAEEALSLLATSPCEVAIVDIRMPGMSGTELLATVRKRWPHIAVILLTGHGTMSTAIAALKEGAHDYLLKPSQPEAIRQAVTEALASARRQREESHLLDTLRVGLQRLEELPSSPPAAMPGTVEQAPVLAGDIRIDRQAYEVQKGDKLLSLTLSEFSLLVVLAENLNQVVDYLTLVRLGLGYDAQPWEAKELVKRHIFSLRQKIESDPASPRYILNVRGVGYRLAVPKSSD
jgi:DNA-binding response OmpR family regulator